MHSPSARQSERTFRVCLHEMAMAPVPWTASLPWTKMDPIATSRCRLRRCHPVTVNVPIVNNETPFLPSRINGPLASVKKTQLNLHVRKRKTMTSCYIYTDRENQTEK